MAGKIKSILVGDKEYKVQMLSVLDSLDLQIEFISNCGGLITQIASMYKDAKSGKEVSDERLGEAFKSINPQTIKPIKNKILERVITPENKFLSDETEIEGWFGRDENKGDIWEVLVKAAQVLLGEYLPSFLKGIMDQIGEKMTEEQSKYPTTSGRKR